MSRYLMLITLGPVQEFILQARRTRDLWFGSHLLSELSKAAAARLHVARAQLIFPATENPDRDLKPEDGPLDGNRQPVFNVANRILALLEADEPAFVAREVREAVEGRWQELAEGVWREVQDLIHTDARRVWDEQIDDLLEFQAVWAPLSSDADYGDLVERLDRTVADRKRLCEFAQWEAQQDGRPRSSLDGARESILRPANRATRASESGERKRERSRYRLRSGTFLQLRANEQLDAVGLVKRAGGDPGHFLSVTNVAFAAWIEHAARRAPKLFDTLCAESRALPGLGKIRLSQPWVQKFPFNANLFQLEQLNSLFDECGIEDLDRRERVKRAVDKLLASVGAPHPYVAVLVADGDRMGETLRQLGTPRRHQEFSRQLSHFAAEARAIVEEQHKGILVYAGGDDVLCFVTLPDAISCAHALHHRFQKIMAQAVPEETIRRPTLSVGIGIGHVLESMSYLLELGRRAEKLAKGDVGGGTGEKRNALALILAKRSGGERSWRARWDGPDVSRDFDPVQRLEADIELLRSDRLSTGKVYQSHAAMRRLKPPASEKERARAWSGVLELEISRILARNELGREGTHVAPPSLEEVGLHIPAAECWETVEQQVQSWCDRLLIARHLLDAGLPSLEAARTDEQQGGVA